MFMKKDHVWWRTWLPRLVGCLLLWWVLTGGDSGSWPIGALTIALTLALMGPRPRRRLSLTGALRFIPYFLYQSLRGGIDVSRRAFSPGLPIDPVLVDYPLRLPPGSARIFLLNSLNLLPGTLSVDLCGDCLRIHVLDRNLDPHLKQLEDHVAALFHLSTGV